MNKYFSRINSEFENILLELSKNSSTTHKDACKKADKYVEEFCKKKNLKETERTEILEYCYDLIADWYPDISYVNLATF
jgi:hypothetical protein